MPPKKTNIAGTYLSLELEILKMPGDPMVELCCTMLHWDSIELFLWNKNL